MIFHPDSLLVNFYYRQIILLLESLKHYTANQHSKIIFQLFIKFKITGLASISTAAIFNIPSNDLATFSYSGSKFLQCPHQGAKNSTNHKPFPFRTFELKSF